MAYVTARYAALAPFGKVAALLSELLPMNGTQHASTVRNRTRRVGKVVVRPPLSVETAMRHTAKPTGAVLIGLDGGYVRNRDGREGRHFEVVAGKVIDAGSVQYCFAFVRNSAVAAADAFKQALAAAGVEADTPVTVLCNGALCGVPSALAPRC